MSHNDLLIGPKVVDGLLCCESRWSVIHHFFSLLDYNCYDFDESLCSLFDNLHGELTWRVVESSNYLFHSLDTFVKSLNGNAFSNTHLMFGSGQLELPCGEHKLLIVMKSLESLMVEDISEFQFCHFPFKKFFLSLPCGLTFIVACVSLCQNSHASLGIQL